MKKVLLATTALAFSAGFASADVTLSGSGRFGLQYNEATGNTTLEKRMTIDINGAGETDGGLSFGGNIRLRNNEGGSTTIVTGARLFVKSGNLEVGVGNIYGAIEWMSGLYNNNVGLTGLGFHDVVTNTNGAYWRWDAYSSSGSGADGVEAIYSSGAFGAHLSYQEATFGSSTPWWGGTQTTAVALSYTTGDWTLAIAHQAGEIGAASNDKTVVTAVGKVGNFNVNLAAADNEGIMKYAVGGSMTTGATTINGYIAVEDTTGVDTMYGLGVSHDLGGASLVGGVSSDEGGNTKADFGISFSF